MKIIKVEAMSNYSVRVTFDDGNIGMVDMNELIRKGIFRVLQDPVSFAKVYSTGEAIAWSEDLEIDGLNLYAQIVQKDPSQLAQKYFTHATD
jgi:hypothetical protein